MAEIELSVLVRQALSGRTRSVPLSWRVYNARSRVLVTEIQVPVRVGQQEKLLEKFEEIQQVNRHMLPGTIARYIVKGNAELTTVHLFLHVERH